MSWEGLSSTGGGVANMRPNFIGLNLVFPDDLITGAWLDAPEWIATGCMVRLESTTDHQYAFPSIAKAYRG